MTLEPPTLADVRVAADAIASYLSLPTPLVYSPALSEQLDAHVSLKLEFATPTGAFKVRGGVHLVGGLAPEHRRAGVVTASTGNHAQSIAYGAWLHDVPAVVFMPEGANADKVAATRRLGAEVRFAGARFDDARRAGAEFAAERGLRFVHSGDEPALIAGVGTAALEVLEQQQPESELVIVPVGGGSGVAGWLTVRDGLEHAARIWAVQSERSSAAHDAWRAGSLVERANETAAEGLATGVAFDLPQRVMRRSLDDFLLVSDAALDAAMIALLELQHLLVEPAGAAALAAALARPDAVRGRRVVLVLSGANVTLDQLARVLANRV
ncbi:MAG: threonine/serine dehydratase [Chloroflexi bacterium]|nr:threonine/serine dehydratase [Chloroflexota bacterium]MDA1003924.1 threonine/serine dehydratase [Chloroflexota bacterium]MQC27932.1 threonine/serine dehydratase [Chloroflexota bacterium]